MRNEKKGVVGGGEVCGIEQRMLPLEDSVGSGFYCCWFLVGGFSGGIGV